MLCVHLHIVYSKLFRNQSFSSVLHHERAQVKWFTSAHGVRIPTCILYNIHIYMYILVECQNIISNERVYIYMYTRESEINIDFCPSLLFELFRRYARVRARASPTNLWVSRFSDIYREKIIGKTTFRSTRGE